MVTISGGHTRTARTLTWRVPRTRGAASGFLLVLLGVWGGLVPFIGPRFGYAYTPDTTWTMTWGRFWLEVLPAAVTVLGGLTLLGSANRVVGVWAGWLTAVAGGWFVLGPSVSRLWAGGSPQSGSPTATTTAGVVVQEIGLFYGLGVVIVFLAATALGRFSVVGVRDVELAAPPPAAQPPAADSPAAETAVIEQERSGARHDDPDADRP